MTKPLDGVRVVDLSQITSGPLATMVLAEQGADVVKVESPTIGDLSRWAPNSRNGVSSFILNQNRGKRSIAVDLRHEAGAEVALDLMAGADVVVQNFRPGVVDDLGVGYDAARARNPGVVYVSISGFGPDGPYADRPVLDPVIQALTGVVHRQQSEAIPLPDLVRNIFIDKATALMVAQSACAALFQRTRTGVGDHIVVPMLDAGLYFFWPDGMMDMTLLGDGIDAGPRIVDLYRITHCADGQLVYYVATDSQRRGLFRALGHPEWIDDPRFANGMALREGDNLEVLGRLLEDAFGALPVAEVLDRLHEGSVPAAPVLVPDDVADDPQVLHNGSLHEWDHPVAGRLRQPRHPIRFASAATPVIEQVPTLGEHTDEILAGLGRTPAEVAALRETGAVA
jgi:crotonobetainyl-CoA:carnitine CoA-transferase CaiB-like acyl-CoA transferase